MAARGLALACIALAVDRAPVEVALDRAAATAGGPETEEQREFVRRLGRLRG